MASRNEITGFLDDLLGVDDFKEEAPDFNGLWVEGSEEVEKVGLCTNTTFENIEAAKESGCDLVIVHHGGWKRFDKDLLEKKKERVEEADVSWYISHQPLDCADDFGVVAALAEKLGISIEEKYLDIQGVYHGRIGRLDVPKEEFIDRLEDLNPDYKTIGDIEDLENPKIGIVPGGGGTQHSIIQETKEEGCDLFITGDCNFPQNIYVKEKDLTTVALGHTSSEKWGVYSLGKRLRKEFPGLELKKVEEKNW